MTFFFGDQQKNLEERKPTQKFSTPERNFAPLTTAFQIRHCLNVDVIEVLVLAKPSWQWRR